MPTNILTPRAGSNLLSLLGDTVRENAARRKDKKLDVHLATQRIADLCAHTSWHAANSRSLLFSAAAADAEQAAEDATALRALLPEAVVAALQALAEHHGWTAINTRRLLLFDAARDRLRARTARSELEALVGTALAEGLDALALHAAWHAANTRSLVWGDAARDAERFASLVVLLPALLRDANLFLNEASRESTPRREASTPRKGSGVLGAIVGARSHTAPTAERERAASASLVEGGGGSGVLGPIVTAWKGVKPSSGGEPCAAFLDAAYATSTIFDPLGSVVAFVKADIKGNADGLSAKAKAHAAATPTLEQLLDAELGEYDSPEAAVATGGSAPCALVWLTRFLRLIEGMLREIMEHPEQPTAVSIMHGYDGALKAHHPWVTQQMVRAGVNAGTRAASTRADFCAKLGQPEDAAVDQMRQLLEHFSPALGRATALLDERGLK